VAPESLAPQVEQIVRGMNPEIAMKFTTLEAMVGESIAAPRFRTELVMTFATLALALAIMGVYAVMSYLTAQRKPEFALRMALGAAPRDILRLVLRRAAVLAAIGAAVGLALAAIGNRAISSLLFGIQSTDATTYALALVGVLPLIVLAAAAPAVRASRVDPMAALRDE
jgi:ABC-type antimicrobial peptide transport system permease subunit